MVIDVRVDLLRRQLAECQELYAVWLRQRELRPGEYSFAPASVIASELVAACCAMLPIRTGPRSAPASTTMRVTTHAGIVQTEIYELTLPLGSLP